MLHANYTNPKGDARRGAPALSPIAGATAPYWTAYREYLRIYNRERARRAD